jgi:hypothetical protein
MAKVHYNFAELFTISPMARRTYSLESHSIRIHPKIWKWACDRAVEEDYEGGVSAYLSGLIIFDRALRRRHWLTKEIMNHPDELEKIINEIEEKGEITSGAWIEHRLEEIFGANKRKRE